ncbi:hypothetical protein MC916_004056 [Elizabethkingia anophelis]|uniref:hypothetical protein n=1 Tax=Elizabethkingia anophelis TaxID=1117645 RepID=UPI001DE98DC2|nr:hypothetical protein [Elizabethkingia anophelis]EHM7982821.1 hypothetical protein [Elizabethkingia anophelis]EHM8030172.1 hypothetical protein [Elizabethkingia anophelis]EHM8034176.1 hypothetical protein [Elizabethkingia anophelis]EHZ9532926.1 hypothetical protein [Elizabethkingia anophelis]EKU3670836.1 hypothetical protein [Elizabethkingia anophelis]
MENIKNFVIHKFGKVKNFLISGSSITQDKNDFSDIDIVIFSSDFAIPQNHTVMIENDKVQFMVVPIRRLESIFYDDFTSFKGSFCHMVANSKIAYSNEESPFLLNVKNHAKELLKTKKRIVDEKNEIKIYQLRFIITNHLLDIKGAKNKEELLFSISELTGCIASLKMILEDQLVRGGGKHKYRALNEFDPDFLQELNVALKSYYTNNDTDPIILFTEQKMELYGGLLTYYSKHNVLTEVHRDCISFSIDKESFKKFKEDILLFLEKENILNTFHSFTSHDKIIFRISSPKKRINNHIIPSLEKLYGSRNIPILFPLRMEIESHLYHIVDTDLYIEILEKLQGTIIDFSFIHSEYLTIKIAFSFLKAFVHDMDKTEATNFLLTLFSLWLPYYYDDGFINSTLVLLKKKRESIRYFSKIYEENKIKLNRLYRIKSNKQKYLSIARDIEKLKKQSEYKLKNLNEWHLHSLIISHFFSMLFIKDSLKPYIVYSFIKSIKEC